MRTEQVVSVCDLVARTSLISLCHLCVCIWRQKKMSLRHSEVSIRKRLKATPLNGNHHHLLIDSLYLAQEALREPLEHERRDRHSRLVAMSDEHLNV